MVQYSMTSTVLNRSGSKRERILEVAEEAVLAKGFAATSIEEIITAVGITKSGFFYHFPDKSDLAKALLQRYIDTRKDCLMTSFSVLMSFTRIRCTAFLSD